MLVRLLLALAPLAAWAQAPCPPVPAYSPCDLVFELDDAEAAAHRAPYQTVQLRAEVKSPRFKTYLLPAFWDGGRRLVIRFAPTEAGAWDYRITSNIARFDGKTGQAQATESEAPGFIKPANLHHWQYTEKLKPHLWMGETGLAFASIGRATFDAIVAERAKQGFTHMRGYVLGLEPDASKAYVSPDQPNPEWFRELDSRVRALNEKNIVADLILSQGGNQLTRVFPTWQQRERYIRYVIGRYSGMNVTWQLSDEYETSDNGRPLLKEIGTLLLKGDSYAHPRSAGSQASSGGLAGDGWMNYLTYNSHDDQLGAIEHQLFTMPAVNLRFGDEDSGAGKADAGDVSNDEFRHRLWNATMNGQYPVFSNTGTSGRKFPVDAKYTDSPGARQMKAWKEFFDDTRFWELEPYFDADGARCIALEGIEYIVYIEKPSQPVEVQTLKHGYEVRWFNPANGESTRMKDWKGEKFVAEAPDKTHDWVLHLARDSRKQSMLTSYKFESRPTPVQEVDLDQQKVPFTIVEPAGDTISLKANPKFAVKIKKDTRATRSMQYLWTGEVTTDGLGYRVIGTGAKGDLKIPANIARKFPAALNIRVSVLNANGKAYAVDRVYRLVE